MMPALIAVALLVACGPPSPTMAQAEAQCRQRADADHGATSQISVGVGTGGIGRCQIGLSSDYLAGAADPKMSVYHLRNQIEAKRPKHPSTKRAASETETTW